MARDENKSPETNDADLLKEAKAKAARRAELKAKRDAEREKRSGESKSDNFRRIANNRTNNALDAIAKLRPLTIKANYEYTPEQAEKIVSALLAEVEKVRTDFTNGGMRKSDTGFTV